jgi:hypothetical protein
MGESVFRRHSSWLGMAAMAGLLTATGLFALVAPASGAGVSGAKVTHGATATHGVKAPHVASGTKWTVPKATNEVDCNGWSTRYTSIKPSMRGLCTDPIQVKKGKAARFIDNGWYVGHDEPSVKFISHATGSGNTMTYYMQVPVDPTKAPTVSGSVTDYGELSIAPWFGLPICDPLSFPQNPCKPDSDSNKSGIADPHDAGSAFMELQLYPPGFGPFTDAFSCSQTQWCAAITIDSLECTEGFATCNPRCEEPVNFAYLQTNGVPAGPPSPQLADLNSEIGNADTLKINPGDVLQIAITDPHAGFTTAIHDLTTGQTGTMVASAANGFMDTSIANCDGRPFTFHAEYNTASPQNQVPWAALNGGVLMEEEIGHFETCNTLAYKDGFSETYPDGSTYMDPDVYQTCIGGEEGPDSVGSGPCNAQTDICHNAETEGTTGPIACPTENAGTGQLCEFADGYCFPKGPRTVRFNGVATTEDWAVAGCNDDQYQNGDLDFDGVPYQTNTWPDGTANHPTPIRYIGPFDATGKPYPTVQFETDIAGSEFLCDTTTGTNCDVKPLGSNFYPFYSLNDTETLSGLSTPAKACVWNFGQDIKGLTTQDFGQDAEYGKPDTARYGGTLISAQMANPEFSGSCPAFSG